MAPIRVLSLAVTLISAQLFAASLDGIKARPLPRRTKATATRPATTAGALRPDEVAARLRTALQGLATVPSMSAVRTKQLATGLRARSPLSVQYRANGTPRQIRVAPPAAGETRATAVSTNALDTARDFLRANRALLSISDPDRELVITSRSTDVLGRTHVRFDQHHEGIPVWPAEIIVHLDPRGEVDLVEGGYIPTPRRLSTKAAISVADAVARARETCDPNAAPAVPELIIYTSEERRPRLAWKVIVRESLTKRWIVVIDAMNGSLLEKFNSIESANVTGSGQDLKGATRTLNVWQSGASFYMVDTTRSMFDVSSQPPNPQTTRGGILIFDARNQPPTNDPDRMPDVFLMQSSSANSWTVPAAVSAAYWLTQTYDYYLERHGRNSIDGNKGSLTAAVRVGLDYPNANWVDEQDMMIFGDHDLYAASVDAIAHEMTHGVTSRSSKLVYKDQSGALNESMSDIFGEMVEARAYGTNDWIIGSQLNRPLRNMANPHQFNYPATMSEFVKTTQDNGGVHINSNIINHAYYNLVQGLSGAISARDGERIFYRANTEHLTKNSQFIDARLAAITSAQELFGANSPQAVKVAEAFDAVEIFGAAATPQEPPIPVVSGPDATLFLFRDDATGLWGLGRKEKSSDGALGVVLTNSAVSKTRPSVTGDGSLAAYVDSDRDVCLIATDPTQPPTCLDLPASGVLVSNVSMAPDASLFAFILFGSDGDPEDRIILVETATGNTAPYQVSVPTYDGTAFSSIRYADQIVFTSDQQFLVYDALNETITDSTAWAAWSIYALSLETGDVFAIMPAVDGWDVGFPSLGHTKDDLLTFEAYQPATGLVEIYATNLNSGDLSLIDQTTSVDTVPAYAGDDRAIVYAKSASNATGASLFRQALAQDSITRSGSPSPWLEGAAYGVIYRRGTYAGPTTQPGSIAFASTTFNTREGSVATVTVTRTGGNKGAVSVNYATSNGSAQAPSDYQSASGTLSWADGEDGVKSFQVRALGDSATEGNETVNVALSGASGGATISSPSTSVVTIANSAAPAAPKRRRSVRR